MTSRDFCFWLQGFFEVSGAKEVTPEQVEMMKKHLNLVFKHEIDPAMGDQNHQNQLNQIHNTIPDHMNPNLTEEELDAKYGEGVRPRC